MPQNSNRAKSKQQQSSQRGKESAPKQGGNKTPVPAPPPAVAPVAPVVVPQSQPAKPNNKSSKIKELNMKGATKEGTDMDAFNDNMDALNANDIIVAETTPIAVNANIITEKIESNDVSSMKPPEFKAPLSRKVDVCDIVRDPPKPFVLPAPVETKDETDRAALSNDKLVQAKNEVNAKVANQSNEEAPETSLPYKDDQWSPLNKDGKKVYGKDFLMALRNFPNSKLKPDNILCEVMAMDDKNRVGDVSRYAISGRTDFAPAFGSSNYSSGKSQSQRGVTTKRGSQQGKVSGNSKGGKSGSVIRVSISFKEDVKLRETENAWKPARLSDGTTDDDKKTAELYRKVRGVLNKLTPQKFNTLISQIKNLPIDTTDRLQGVIDLVFEKAVDEPNFSVAYALMCRELALTQVPSSTENKQDFVNFRKLLVTRCQMEFEKNSTEEGRRNEKLIEIEECTDPEKKKELMINLDEDDRRIRVKSVGNIRFIGELFKQQMLTVNIMMRCLLNLLDNRDEERLECLCKLLTTVGKELESKKVDLGRIFGTMKDIADDKKGKVVSSRVRFMLQDVIDLRNGNWVPRRQDLNPKTIDQIQKEAENEQLTIQAMNSGPITPRKDDRNSGSNADRKRGGNRNVTNDDGWSTATSRNKNVPFTVQSDKLKIKQPTVDEPLGSSKLFGSWVRGSNIKPGQHPGLPPTNSANMFAALEKFDIMDNRSMNSRPNSKDPYSSKGHSMERTYKQYDGRGSRSGSQHRSDDRSQHRSNEGSQRSTPTPMQQIQSKLPVLPVEPKIPAEKLDRMIKNIIEEYINDCCSLEDAQNEIKNTLPLSTYEQFVEDAYTSILDRSRTARLKTGNLLAQLMKNQTLQLDSYCNALEKVFSIADDLIVDIPCLWDYYAELIYAPVSELLVPLNILHKCAEPIECTHKLLASLFKVVIAEKGPNHLLSIWNNSNTSFNDWMGADQVHSFISSNQLEFLVGSSVAPIGQSNLSFNQIHKKLTQFVQSETSFDDINKWINANVADRVKDKQFIRVLATVVIENSIVSYKLDVDKLRRCYPFILLYVDNCSDFELQCLYAIQSIVNKLDHPQGLLLKIFNTLYEDTTISYDSFISWEQSNDPAEQDKKGVAVKQLTSFFTQLRENDDEESSSGSDDA